MWWGEEYDGIGLVVGCWVIVRSGSFVRYMV